MGSFLDYFVQLGVRDSGPTKISHQNKKKTLKLTARTNLINGLQFAIYIPVFNCFQQSLKSDKLFLWILSNTKCVN